jgi:H+/Cl- antiporter ClcA
MTRPRLLLGEYRSLIAVLVPPVAFVACLLLVLDEPRFRFLASPRNWPWELWLIVVAGLVATVGGVLDWRFHRRGDVRLPPKESRSEFLALACGGIPLFALMAAASTLEKPLPLLLPVIVVALVTATLICYDEFVFHRRRCGAYETRLHRMLVFGNALAWLAWSHWCFVRGAESA